MYVNVTGPGDYNIPGFADRYLGESQPDSNKRTAPTKKPYWPSYEVDFKG